MKKVVCLMLSVCLLLVAVVPVFAETASVREFYIAVDGSDENPGTKDAPFATLERARDAIREMKSTSGLPTGGVRVYLREGQYTLDQTFQLTAEDSGTKECPIVYMSYPGERAEIYGGKVLPASGFKSVSDQDAIAKIPKTALKNIYEFDLKSVGITDYGTMEQGGYGYPEKEALMQVYFDETMLELSRWPNEGFAETGEVVDAGKIIDGVPNEQKTEDFYNTGGPTFQYYEEDPSQWADEKDVMLFGYWMNGWSPNQLRVEEIDASARTIKLQGPTMYGIAAGKQYYAYNILQELDAPGEYYIDREAGMLYLYPPSDIKAARVEVSTLKGDLINLTGTSYVTIADLTVGLTLGNGISVQEGDFNIIRGCTVKECYMAGILIGQSSYTNPGWNAEPNMKTGGTNNGVLNCEVYTVGMSGIILSSGWRTSLEPGNCYAYNNKVHDYAQIEKTYKAGIELWGVGNYARYNEVYNAPHFGIYFNGNNNIMEYNDVHDVLKETDDAGAFYTYGWYSFQGNHVDYNYIHDIASTGDGYAGVHAVYLDYPVSNNYIVGNIVQNIQNGGLFTNGGHQNKTIHNILIDVLNGVQNNAYGAGWDPEGEQVQNQLKNLFDMPIDSEVWQQNYPGIENIATNNPQLPMGVEVIENVFVNSGMVTADAAVEVSKIEGNIEFSDPEKVGFVDYKNGNLNLKEDSEIYAKIPDFPQIDFDRMGMYSDSLNTLMNDTVSLMIGSPVAFVKGEEARVDADNAAVMPLIVDSRTLVPVRFISESFGANVGWDADTATVSVDIDGKHVQLVIGSNEMQVDGDSVTLDVPAQSIEGRTMIPLRALVEAIGKQVFWDERGLILISDEEATLATEQPYLLDDLITRFR